MTLLTLTPITWNDAISASMYNPLVKLFYNTCRGTDKDKLKQMLCDAWEYNAVACLKSIFQLRDCRGGKGERLLGRIALKWLYYNHFDVFMKNMCHIPFFGRYDDLAYLNKPETLKLIAKTLYNDRHMLSQEHKQISLCAKWSPSESKNFDQAKQLCKLLHVTKKQYRQLYISPLRKHLNIVERNMCQNVWDKINFEHVPSCAMKKYRKAFKKHLSEQLTRYLENVKNGTQKINATQVFPHELVKQYITNTKMLDDGIDCVIEQQWRVLVEKHGKLFGTNSVAIVDVSGSMSYNNNHTPISVAVALGILVALNNKNNGFYKHVLTFSSEPRLHSIANLDSLFAMVRDVRDMNWGMSTDFQKALTLLLKTCIKHKVEMPQFLYVFSDMQFNEADNNYKTNHDALKKQFKNAGYKLPVIVYWNLSGKSTDCPISNDEENDVILLSGYSPSILTNLLNGEEINPLNMVLNILNAPRYDVLSV